eukprot:TRINITY_DN29143_c0_g1_i1.p1 TRINITY_DN29143_c0_g1~~TRINITY_DN29143_c0_g1_i1.p1  ORF type:complete len:325 (+),score=56.47 TRINITY_DN29143_c0_g1_i1:81-977(+)
MAAARGAMGGVPAASRQLRHSVAEQQRRNAYTRELPRPPDPNQMDRPWDAEAPEIRRQKSLVGFKGPVPSSTPLGSQGPTRLHRSFGPAADVPGKAVYDYERFQTDKPGYAWSWIDGVLNPFNAIITRPPPQDPAYVEMMWAEERQSRTEQGPVLAMLQRVLPHSLWRVLFYARQPIRLFFAFFPTVAFVFYIALVPSSSAPPSVLVTTPPPAVLERAGERQSRVQSLINDLKAEAAPAVAALQDQRVAEMRAELQRRRAAGAAPAAPPAPPAPAAGAAPAPASQPGRGWRSLWGLLG